MHNNEKILEIAISTKVIKGSFWILFLRITNRILGLIRTAVLAKLLLPEHFGLIGIAIIIITILETFSQPGLGTALVQKKEDIKEYLNTAWTASIIRSIIIYAVLYFSSPLVSNFFHEPEAVALIRVFGLSAIIAGFRNIGVVYFQKELDFKKQYIYELSIILGNIVVAIPAAFIMENVWALALGGMAGSLTRFFMSYVLHPFRPRLFISAKKFMDLFSFGKWILGSSILAFLITQGDDLFLAKMFGASALGLYQMAYMISNLPTTETASVISHVTFPAYSKIQNDILRFQSAYMKVLQIVFFLAAPVSGAIFLFAPNIIKILLSDKWIAIAPLLKIMVWAGLLRAILDTTSSVFNAVGNPKINAKWQLSNLVSLTVLIYPLARSWGLMGVALAVLSSNLLAVVVASIEVKKILDLQLIKLLKILILPLIAMLISMFVIFWLGKEMNYDSLSEIIILLFVGGLFYAFLSYIFDKIFKYNITQIIRTSIFSLKIIKS